MNLDAVLSFLAATLRTATPIALATLACTISERAGVINIGIEGTMIASAFTGAVGAYYSGSAWVGLKHFKNIFSDFYAVRPPESFLQQSLQACPFIAAAIRS